jgi:glycosyltransferase involved in cell wall biosynthesis
MKAKRRLLWVTDIPTPYRAHLLTAVGRAAAERDIELDVRFMARSVAMRQWTVDPSEMDFRYEVAKGLHFQIKSAIFHFNPGVVWEGLRTPADWLIVGGTWWMPTSVASMLAAGARGSCKIIMHLEANRHAMNFHSGPVTVLRRAVLDRAHAYAVPGRIAVETVESFGVSSGKVFLPLPNLVDETKFGARIAELKRNRAELRQRHGIDASDFAMIWPARLDERLKGILRFLDTVKDLVPPNVKILLAGEGADRPKIEAWVAEHLPRNVRLLGYQREGVMLELLAAADALLLPSVVDPNPLSVVEALWAGLPLLISNRCGNSPEAIDEGRNGWAVDPCDAESVRAAFRRLVESSPRELSAMGTVSRDLAERRFSTKECVDAFVAAVDGL